MFLLLKVLLVLSIAVNLVLLLFNMRLKQEITRLKDLKPLVKKEVDIGEGISKSAVELPKHLREKYVRMESNKLELLNKANLDDLTGVLNKGKILNDLSVLVNNVEERFVLLMFDIDDFKNINDTYGHMVGDDCIRQLAGIAKKSSRSGDLIGRYGGDEFLVVLRGLAGEEGAMSVVDRFRIRVATESDPDFTISIGVASYPFDGKRLKDLVCKADKALYRAKEQGKNKVVFYDEAIDGLVEEK